MKTYLFVAILLSNTLLLSGCQLFQTVDTPVDNSLKAPTAQEQLTQALQNLYQLHSGTFIENFDLNLERSALDHDRWTANITENWQDNPSQSLSNIHLSLTLPPPASTEKAAQGIIDIHLARAAQHYFFELASAHFAGPDGKVLDDILQKSANQWFILPSTPAPNYLISTIQTLLNFTQQIRTYPAEILTTAKYFHILDATTVQADSGQAEKLTVSLDNEGISTLINTLRQQAATSTNIDFDLVQKFLDSSKFEGSILIDTATQNMNQIDGTLTIQSNTTSTQNMTLKIHIELANLNEHVPLALPTQTIPLPADFLSSPATAEPVAQ